MQGRCPKQGLWWLEAKSTDQEGREGWVSTVQTSIGDAGDESSVLKK